MTEKIVEPQQLNLRPTEEKTQAEVALNKSDARFWHLFDNMRSGVAVYEVLDNGRDFIFVGFNQAAEQISNKKREDLLGRSILELFLPVEKFGLLELFQRVWETGEPEHHPAAEIREGTFPGYLLSRSQR